MKELKGHAHNGFNIIVVEEKNPPGGNIFLIVDGEGDVQGQGLTLAEAEAEISRLGISRVKFEANVIPESLLVHEDGGFFIVAEFSGGKPTESFLVFTRAGNCLKPPCSSLQAAKAEITRMNKAIKQATGFFENSLKDKSQSGTPPSSKGMHPSKRPT